MAVKRTRVLTAGAVCLLAALGGAATLDGRAAAEPTNRCAPSENGAPVLRSVDISPATVDVRQGPAPVAITVKALDSGRPGWPTGVRSVEVGLTNGVSATLHYAGSSLWRGTATFPRWSAGGTVEASYVGVSDRADWPARGTGEPPPFDVVYQATGEHTWAGVTGRRSVAVLSDPDTTAPRVTDLDLTPAVVDTRTRARRVTVGVRATDGGSGVSSGTVTLARQTGLVPVVIRLARVAGRPGLLSGVVTVPRSAGTSTWAVLDLSVADRAGQVRSMGAPELTAAGLPTGLRVTSGPLAPAGRSYIRSFTASTGQVDVRTTGAKVAYRLRVTNGAGRVKDVSLSFPSAAGIQVGRPRLVSGDRHDGIWTATAVLDTCLAHAGTFRPVATAFDRVRDHALRGPALAVRAGDNTDPEVASATLGTELVLTFSEPVDGITQESMPVTRLPNGTKVAGSWTCSPSAHGGCFVDPVRTAVFTPDVPLTRATYRVTVNPEHYLDVTDLAGNPVRPRELDVTGPSPTPSP